MSLNQQLFDRSLKVSPGGVHSPVRAFKSVGGTPIFFKKSLGPYLYDVDGKEYIDFCMSFGPMILGHRDPTVQEAVLKMIDTAWTFGACEPYSLELAEWITKRLSHIEKLRFVSSGTEAVMSLLRVARAATGRQRVLKFDGCYHGHMDSMLVKSGSGLAGEATSDSAGVPASVAHDTLVAPLDNEEALHEMFKKYGNEIAAVIIEPMPANYGLLVQRESFLRALREVCTKYGALLIFDEVISGFRVALGGMVERTKIIPDLVAFGKVLGGGFNVAAYGGKKEFLDLVAPNGPVYQAGTLSANPVGMTAGLTTLQKMEDINGYQTLELRTAEWSANLNKKFKTQNIPLHVSSVASVFWMHAVTENEIRDLKHIPENHKANYAKLFHKMTELGLYMAPSGFEVGFVSMAHTPEVLEKASGLILKAATETLLK